MSGKLLLTIDRLFWIPYRVTSFMLSRMVGERKTQRENVMMIKLMGMGSIIQIGTLCKRHTIDQSKIYFITLDSNREACRIAGFHHMYLIRTTHLFYFIADCFKLIFRVRSLGPRLIIDYERCSHAVALLRSILSAAARCQSVSFEYQRKHSDSRERIYDADILHQHDLFMKGLESLSRYETVVMQTLLHGDKTKVIININASGYFLGRRYARDHFIRIILSLHRWNPHLNFFLTGSQREFGYVDQLIQQLGDAPAMNVCGKWDLHKLVHELATCALFITCDSGPLHLAVSVKTPTIAIWGPTQPEHFGYEQVDNLHHVSLQLPCSPCLRHPASTPGKNCHGHISCLTDLPWQNIDALARQILDRSVTLSATDETIVMSRLTV